MKSIGVIGKGFVGGTLVKVVEQMTSKYEVRVFDIDPVKATHTEQETMSADVVFVCLPTPMILDTGECHIDFVRQAVAKIRAVRQDNWIVIKSTVPPGTTQALDFSYGKVCFNPEFLTEAKAYEDFIGLPYQIIGHCSTAEEVYPVAEIFLNACSSVIMACKQVFYVHATQAEMVKYTRNTYLATRLSFFNEIKQICDKMNVDFDQMKWFAGLDERVGQHYSTVEKGNQGFGGHCLPKDLKALIFLARHNDVYVPVLEGAWEKNLEVREHYDWENQVNRAVIDLNKKQDENVSETEWIEPQTPYEWAECICQLECPCNQHVQAVVEEIINKSYDDGHRDGQQLGYDKGIKDASYILKKAQVNEND